MQRSPHSGRTRTRHSTAAAYLALFCALAGTAWAAATIGSGDVVNNSLRSADLRNNAAVKTADVANATLGGADVRNNSLRGSDFGADSVGGADTNEAGLSVGRIVHSLGGAVNLQVTTTLQNKVIPNGSFTQGPSESAQIFGTAQVTFPAGCTSPRVAAVYLLLDDPVNIGQSVVGIAQVFDNGAGTVTKRASLGSGPFGAGPYLFRTGAAEPHQVFVQAGGSCNTGGGIMLDSVAIDVVGHR